MRFFLKRVMNCWSVIVLIIAAALQSGMRGSELKFLSWNSDTKIRGEFSSESLSAGPLLKQ